MFTFHSWYIGSGGPIELRAAAALFSVFLCHGAPMSLVVCLSVCFPGSAPGRPIRVERTKPSCWAVCSTVPARRCAQEPTPGLVLQRTLQKMACKISSLRYLILGIVHMLYSWKGGCLEKHYARTQKGRWEGGQGAAFRQLYGVCVSEVDPTRLFYFIPPLARTRFCSCRMTFCSTSTLRHSWVVGESASQSTDAGSILTASVFFLLYFTEASVTQVHFWTPPSNVFSEAELLALLRSQWFCRHSVGVAVQIRSEIKCRGQPRKTREGPWNLVGWVTPRQAPSRWEDLPSLALTNYTSGGSAWKHPIP